MSSTISMQLWMLFFLHSRLGSQNSLFSRMPRGGKNSERVSNKKVHGCFSWGLLYNLGKVSSCFDIIKICLVVIKIST